MHPRNRHQDRYDFAQLIGALPELQRYVVRTPTGQASIDFSNAVAVRLLNGALLRSLYGIEYWDIPDDYLCPPIPGRADYLHGLADLLASDNHGVIPRGPSIRALDLGTGASCIYPLLGHGDYGWSFVGSDLDLGALKSAQTIIDRNRGLRAVIELRRQSTPGQVLHGVLRGDETFDLCLCNPPFHRSAAEAAAGSTRKWRNLGQSIAATTKQSPRLNFGGQQSELWCRGGELAFVSTLIDESVDYAASICWFSSLIAKSSHLAQLQQRARRAGALRAQVVNMAQGHKQSRFLAWSFMTVKQLQLWRERRWQV